MGFLPSHLRLLIRSHRKHSFRGPVCTLGNQETWASYSDLEALFQAADCVYPQVGDVHRHTSRMFSDDAVLTALAKDFVHAKVFFRMLGIDEYTDIDAFDFDKPLVVHDLNQPIPTALADAFGLVIDGGTIEHIFDVRGVLTNVVRMLRVGGHVVHMASFEMDHGFYSFSPCLFFDFYAANGFSDFTCIIVQFDYEHILSNYREPVPYFEYRYGMRMEKLFDPKRKPAVFFVARKDRDMDALVPPFQGIYLRRAGLAQVPVEEGSATPHPERSLFEAIVPKILHRPLAPLRPFLARGRRRLRQYLEGQKGAQELERI